LPAQPSVLVGATETHKRVVRPSASARAPCGRRCRRSGGEGSWTPVLEAVYASFYMFIRW